MEGHRIQNMIKSGTGMIDDGKPKESDLTEPTKHKKEKKNNSNFSHVCCTIFLFLFGSILIPLGILMFIYPLQELALRERLEFETWLPLYGWWKNPEPIVYCNVYLWSVTNSEDFLSGKDDILKLKEVGPITYREHLNHEDVVFHKENHTLSYTVERKLEFLGTDPSILNQSFVGIDLATMNAAASYNDKIFIKIPLNFLLNRYKISPFTQNMTVYNYLWNLTSPVLETANHIPNFVPTLNAGILDNMYKNNRDRVNVKYGKVHGPQNFFAITSYGYQTVVPGFNPNFCNATLHGSSEGAHYPQQVTKATPLWYFRKTLCRPVALHFEEEIDRDPLIGYKYGLQPNEYDRNENLTADCYKGLYEVLPNGLSDMGKCYYDMPMVASLPHFLYRSGNWTKRLEGINPIKEKHESYAIVEPTLGIPLKQAARSQTNIVIPNLSGYKADFVKLKNMVIPIFWVEYLHNDMPPKVIATLNFFVNILPAIQYYIAFGFVMIGLIFVFLALLRIINKNRYKLDVNKNKA